ncbi:hypothetical protein HK104_010334, partial [Borealophlyctis nickersoniae]
NLPFGYGSAGGRFVVEEVGEVDDDEEEVGEYQVLRVAERVGEGVWSTLDEYWVKRFS